MSLDLNEFKSDLLEVRDDLPVTFTLNGTAYTGFQTERTSTEDLEPGGFITDYDLALHVPLNVRVNGAFTATFPGAQPAIGDTVTITTNGTTSYKVGRTGRTQDGLELVLGLRTLGR